ncbi:MAG: glycosyltransferase, partial [Myxococcota bacterium]
MRTLHVACQPFPSPQGTQALIGAMLEALRASGDAPELLAYAHGEGRAPAVPVHRVPDWPRARSLRSGPSFAKVALDLRAVAALRALVRRRAPALVVAHSVEAALVARAARVPNVAYVAHTRFDAELPSYAPARLSAPLEILGARLDALAVGAGAVAAVAPSLADALSARFAIEARALPVPWPPAGALPPPIGVEERRAA